MQKLEELLADTKLGALLKKEEEEKNKGKVCWIVASVLAVVAVAGIAYALYYSCLKDLKSQTVALYSYIDPVVSVLLAILILNESMSFMKLIGAVLILGAAIIGEIKPKNV